MCTRAQQCLPVAAYPYCVHASQGGDGGGCSPCVYICACGLSHMVSCRCGMLGQLPLLGTRTRVCFQLRVLYRSCGRFLRVSMSKVTNGRRRLYRASRIEHLFVEAESCYDNGQSCRRRCVVSRVTLRLVLGVIGLFQSRTLDAVCAWLAWDSFGGHRGTNALRTQR